MMQRRLPAQPRRRGMAAATMAATTGSLLLVVALLLLAAGLADLCHAFDMRSPANGGRAFVLIPSIQRFSSAPVVGSRFQRPTTVPCIAGGGGSRPSSTATATTTQLFAKKKQRESKGFGKPTEASSKSSSEADAGSSTSTARSPSTATPTASSTTPFTPLQSVSGDWASPSSGAAQASPVRDEEDLLTPEERAARLLREKYGMKTMGEQQSDAKQQEAMKEQRKKFAEWKKKLDSGSGDSDQDFDIMAVLPAPVLRAIDGLLKVGVTIAGGAFVLSGIGITLEAWSKTTGNSIDPTLDAFIVETVEPNFTVGLLVLLSFSVSLGLFSAAQLGSAAATYKEND